MPPDALTANWVPGAHVVYIGKADHGRLQKRLRELDSFGAGSPVGHWGGRLIWQLRGVDHLLLAWRLLPATTVPRVVEKGLIDDFRLAYGKPPFANDPHRLGR